MLPTEWLTEVQSILSYGPGAGLVHCHGMMECRYKEGSYEGALQLLTSSRLFAFP